MRGFLLIATMKDNQSLVGVSLAYLILILDGESLFGLAIYVSVDGKVPDFSNTIVLTVTRFGDEDEECECICLRWHEFIRYGRGSVGSWENKSDD